MMYTQGKCLVCGAWVNGMCDTAGNFIANAHTCVTVICSPYSSGSDSIRDTSSHLPSKLSYSLPLDVARCLGRATLDPDERVCTLRDTCRRYQAMLTADPAAYVAVMMLTDEDGECRYYMEDSDE